jgi:hypothetical protein
MIQQCRKELASVNVLESAPGTAAKGGVQEMSRENRLIIPSTSHLVK